MPSPNGQLPLMTTGPDEVVVLSVVILSVVIGVVVVDCWPDGVVFGFEVTGEFPLRADLTALINGYLPYYMRELEIKSKYVP